MEKKKVYKAKVRILRAMSIYNKGHEYELIMPISLVIEKGCTEREISERIKEREDEIKKDFWERYYPQYGPFKIIEIIFKNEKERSPIQSIDERSIIDISKPNNSK